MTEPEFVDPSQLRPGPIRNASLSPELIARIRNVYTALALYLDTTLEQFEIGFMRDLHPESEVAIWERITCAWIAYHQKYLDNRLQSVPEEQRLIGALTVISTGVDDVESFGVPSDVGRHLLACYQAVSELDGA